jgi:hypothetical protein
MDHLPQPSDEQLEQIEEFVKSDACTLIFERMQRGIIQDWASNQDPEAREKCWLGLQTLLQLHAALRDAKAMKHMDGRAQERRPIYRN